MKAAPLLGVAVLLIAGGALAGPPEEGAAIMQRVAANRPRQDYALRARLWVGREPAVPVEIFVKAAATEVRTLYRAAKTEFLVVQPQDGPEHFYLRGSGELRGAPRLGRFLGSEFSYYDLGLPFLRWPHPVRTDTARFRGRSCDVVQTAATGEPYARVQLWIDQEYSALLRAEASDEDGKVIKRFSVTSFKKIGGAWAPRGLEIASVPPGQALPAQDKSRLEIYEGQEDPSLPGEWFEPARF